MLDLPTDRPRPASQSFRGARSMRYFDRQAIDVLTARCKEHEATLFMGLLAAWFVLLHRYSGQDDIVVTAQRREQNQRDVPISLTAFSGDAVDKQNFQGVESYFSQTPNVSFTSQGSRDRKVLALRGVSDLLSPDSNIREGSFA